MRKITLFLLMAVFSLTAVQAQTTKSYSADQVATLLNDLVVAVDGDVFELTTPGDQGFYKIDSMPLEVWADVTIKSAADMAVKPMVKLVYNQEYADAEDTSMVDYLVRLRGTDVDLTLYNVELQGDTNKTKYGIRTMKLADVTGADSYKDPDWTEDSVVQNYTLNILNCDMNGIKSGSDGRGLMLYVGTRGTINIENSIFSSINRDAINMYTDGTRTTANGPFKYVESIMIKNSTFYNLGREAITYRNSGEDATDPANKSRASMITVDHCIFDSCGANSATDSYYCFRTDPAQLTVTNCIFSNMTTKEYIVRNNNSNSVISDIALVNINAVDSDGNAIEWADIEDAVDFEDDSRDEESIYMNTLDPMYADRSMGDFTYGATATTLGKGNDGKDLGDLRWSADWVASDNADLKDITVDGTSIEGFAPETESYTVTLPFGTTVVPEVLAVTFSPDASYEAVTPTTLPGSYEFTVTSADGFVTKEYDVLLIVSDVSVDEEELEANSLYPNPSNGTFTIANNAGSTLVIYSLTGQAVHTQFINTNEQIINADLTKGVYMITVSNLEARKTSKIIID